MNKSIIELEIEIEPIIIRVNPQPRRHDHDKLDQKRPHWRVGGWACYNPNLMMIILSLPLQNT